MQLKSSTMSRNVVLAATLRVLFLVILKPYSDSYHGHWFDQGTKGLETSFGRKQQYTSNVIIAGQKVVFSCSSVRLLDLLV